MASGLARLGVDVTVIATNADRDARLEVPVGVPIVRNDVAYMFFNTSVSHRWRMSLALTRWIARHVGEYDLLHVHSLFSFPNIPACRLARGRGVPYIVRPAGMLDPWSLAAGARRKRLYLRLVEHAHLAAADMVHVTSELEFAAVAARIESSKLRLIRLGVAPLAMPSNLPPDTGGVLRILHLSRLHPVKGLPTLLRGLAEARASDPRFQLTIAGDGNPDYERELRDLAGQLGLRECVSFVGHADAAMKARLLSEHHVFVSASQHENFGVAIVEAMAAGLPVIVTDQVGVAPDVAESGAGLVVPSDAGRLCGALLELGRDPGRRACMGRAAVRLATTRFTWDECCGELLASYRSVLSAHQYPPRAAPQRARSARGSGRSPE
jgi:glycosyltransferase involved in cell wall biosynthesis